MPELLLMPAVGPDTTEAVLLSWPVAETVPFHRGDTIVTVETAKAVVDVEAETDGVILRILATEGTEVAVGAPIALIAGPSEVVTDVPAALAELTAPQHRDQPVPSISDPQKPPAPTESRVFAGPLARRLAKEANLPTSALIGTGPHRRIVRRDVETAIAAMAAMAGAQFSAPTDGGPSEPLQPVIGSAPPTPVGYTDRALSRQRRMMAARLSTSKQTIPHFYLRGVARVDKLLDLRAQINQDVSGRVSVNDFVIKAVARAHMLVPVLNVSYHDETIRHYTDVDVAVAIAAPTGLLTPVVRAADARSIREIGATVRQFVGQAASGQLRQHQLEGGSITVSNLGMYGVQEFAAIINPPQASILAVGAIRPEVTVRKGKVRPANMMHLTLSVDHRAVDGAQAAEWMAALLALLEHPLRLVVG